MSKLLRKPKGTNEEITAKYQIFGLTENPFPVSPFINNEHDDDRYNGKIYESKIREIERGKFIDQFIRVPQSDRNHHRLGYLLDSSYVGRGNGKTAFAVNLIAEINQDYCWEISDGVNKCFGVYVVPEPSGRNKTFGSLVDKIFESIYDSGIIGQALASLRLESILSLYPNKFSDNDLEDEDKIISLLNEESWYNSNKIKISEITKNIFKTYPRLDELNIDFPLCRDKKNAFTYRVIKENDFKEYYNGLKKGRQRLDFIFNELVLFFLSSGFNGSYLIIDDFERIPDFQSEKLKQEFALELRTHFFDGLSENAKIGFYNLFLVLHAGVPRLLSNAWAISGMVRRSPMLTSDNPSASAHVISFEKLTVEHVVMLLEIYLDKYRIANSNNKHGLHPFTREAARIIGQRAEMNAASILRSANYLIDMAVEENVASIDLEFVQKKLGAKEDSVLSELDVLSKDDPEDLFKKAGKK